MGTGANLNERNTSRETDLDRLSRLKALSWLSQSELTLLIGAMALANYKRHSVILREVALARDAHILLAGIARITCPDVRKMSRLLIDVLRRAWFVFPFPRRDIDHLPAYRKKLAQTSLTKFILIRVESVGTKNGQGVVVIALRLFVVCLGRFQVTG